MKKTSLLLVIFSLFVTISVCSQNKGWGDIEYEGRPWVRNVSQPYKVSRGLQNRHLSVTASHGRFYDNAKGYWRWQRPNLFGTTEDLYTQTIVVPLLIPMLEKAGAVVYTARERDWQKAEVIVDNDNDIGKPGYKELTQRKAEWQVAPMKGFALHAGSYSDGENPFNAGTARMCETTRSERVSSVSYQPELPAEGAYAVYVSYQTLPNSIDDAEYIVYHKGQETRFHVNQHMGGTTWVYLGTFAFDAGFSTDNRVVVTNRSRHDGVVTTDAVRFGGGMGNISRGNTLSTVPRCLEGARYTAQWAGAPYSVYSYKNGTDDYRDDINSRSALTNWIAGGSVYVPHQEGKRVPIELSLAVHSDAGYDNNYTDLVGTLSICTTNHNNGLLDAGVSRQMSRTFADMLLDNTYNDLVYKYGKWARREVYDRNYSETREPMIPSAIIETLSHQNFPDMVMGQDPNFKFTLARSIYKTILRYVCQQHGERYVVSPLTPDHFSVLVNDKGKAELRWKEVKDPQERSADAEAYRLYIAQGNGDYGNGQMVKSTSVSLTLKPNVLYRFRVSAVNDGGESFPTEELAAVYHSGVEHTLMIVNGFHRLSAPTVINTETRQGFDLKNDIGVWQGITAGWNGPQTDYDKSAIGQEGPGGLGYGTDDYVGRFLVGNTFDYPTEHARAMCNLARFNISSCSVDALSDGDVKLKNVDGIDLILGLECNDGRSLVEYKTFTPKLQKVIRRFASQGGRLLVSGAYIGSDMTSEADRRFIQEVLKADYKATISTTDIQQIQGIGGRHTFFNTPNEKHYAIQSADVIEAIGGAFTPIVYENGYSAATAYDGQDYKSFVMAVPIECITQPTAQKNLIEAILSFLF